MIRFAEIFPERTIIHTLCGQLTVQDQVPVT
jgi:hypothetical protein